MAISEAYAALLEFAISRGANGISGTPGAWHAVIDAQWEVWLNPHGKPAVVEGRGEIGPFEAYVEFNGWPAGFFGPHGGAIAAGAAANEDALISALRAATLARHGIEYDPAHCPFCEPVVVSSSDDLGGDVCTMHMEHAADCRRKETS